MIRLSWIQIFGLSFFRKIEGYELARHQCEFSESYCLFESRADL